MVSFSVDTLTIRYANSLTSANCLLCLIRFSMRLSCHAKAAFASIVAFKEGQYRNLRYRELGTTRGSSAWRTGPGMGSKTKCRRGNADLPKNNCITWLSKVKKHLAASRQGHGGGHRDALKRAASGSGAR